MELSLIGKFVEVFDKKKLAIEILFGNNSKGIYDDTFNKLKENQILQQKTETGKIRFAVRLNNSFSDVPEDIMEYLNYEVKLNVIIKRKGIKRPNSNTIFQNYLELIDISHFDGVADCNIIKHPMAEITKEEKALNGRK